MMLFTSVNLTKMVKLTSTKFKMGVQHFQTRRGTRHAHRLRHQLHEKKLSGTHFIRTATWVQLNSGRDLRKYVDMLQNVAYTSLTAMQDFNVLVKVAGETRLPVMIQLFTKDNQLVEEETGLLMGTLGAGFGMCVNDGLYNGVVASVRQCGTGYVFSTDNNVRTEIQMYNNAPHEMLCGLPARKLINMKNGHFIMNPSCPIAPFMKGTQEKDLVAATKDYHVSQGRSREPVKGSERPLANCAYCHSRENAKKRFNTCAACKMKYYCCKKCQENDWSVPRPFCKRNRV